MRTKQSYIDAGKKGYLASKEKNQKRLQELIHNYLDNPEKCKKCNSSIPYEKRLNEFCSSSCSATFNNLNKGIKFNVCRNCGNQAKKIYCGIQCQQDYQWEQWKKEVEAKQVADSRGSKSIKKYLIEKSGQKCCICNITEWQGLPLVTILDHIDGNSSNWRLNNLRLICSNCDTTLPTYKGRNKGNGRHLRRARYKAGKSY